MSYVCNMKGIYKIVNKVNQKFYLGSSVNLYKRMLRHFNSLRKNKHHNIHLQRAFNKYGENNFEFVVIEECDNTCEREQILLDELDFKMSYNVSKTASGGDMIHNHPEKEKLIKEAIDRLRSAKRPSLKGDKNSNWRGGSKKCACGVEVHKNTKSCNSCRDKTGESNPFFGKQHSTETKLLISQSRVGKYFGNQEKVVIVNGMEYPSLSAAAKIFKVVPATILNRIRSKNYPTYSYK